MASFITIKNNLRDPEKMQEAETEMFADLAPCGSNRWRAMWLGSALKKRVTFTSQSLKKEEQCCESFQKAHCKSANMVTLYALIKNSTPQKNTSFFSQGLKKCKEDTKKSLSAWQLMLWSVEFFQQKTLWEKPFTLYNKNHQSSLILNGRIWLLFSTKMLNCNKDLNTMFLHK